MSNPHLSVTRLKLRWTRPLVLLSFLRLSLASAEAAERSPGFLTGALWVGARLTFWTLTLWKDERSMHTYARGAVHKRAMTHLSAQAEAYTEAAFASGAAPSPALPNGATTHKFLSAHGAFYPLPHPSSDHAAHRVVPPVIWAVRPLTPNAAPYTRL